MARYETFVAQWLARGRRLEEDRDEAYAVRDLVADYYPASDIVRLEKLRAALTITANTNPLNERGSCEKL